MDDTNWFMWFSWLFFFPFLSLFLAASDWLKDNIYPKIIRDQNKRQIFDALSLWVGIGVTLLLWVTVLNWWYF